MRYIRLFESTSIIDISDNLSDIIDDFQDSDPNSSLSFKSLLGSELNSEYISSIIYRLSGKLISPKYVKSYVSGMRYHDQFGDDHESKLLIDNLCRTRFFFLKIGISDESLFDSLVYRIESICGLRLVYQPYKSSRFNSFSTDCIFCIV